MAKIGFKGDVSDVWRVRGLWMFQRTDVVMALRQDDTGTLLYNGKGPEIVPLKESHVMCLFFLKVETLLDLLADSLCIHLTLTRRLNRIDAKSFRTDIPSDQRDPGRKELSRTDEQEASQTDTVAQ